MKKSVLVFGSMGGLVFVCWMAVVYTLCFRNPNFEANMWLGYGSMIVAFSFIFVAIKNYRDKLNNGYVSFGTAFKMGLYVALIASTMYVLAWLVDFYVFMPDFMDKFVAHSLVQAKAHGATVVELNKKREDMATMAKIYKTPIGVIALTYLEVLPVGLVIALIAALILRRPRQVEQGEPSVL